ncbi:hypothetical protein BSL78_06598 [Apostichopus japonicus]|uniref:Reverse transcriptase n=1 Tax=Stichopus japonicus TaxID=307972 RepID=A0A2G8L891_STIJA|nr:hypothetical protein BSL78_06598 [Apostichopus japonicus]
MALFGKLEEFREGREEWIQYVEGLEHFFAANSIADEVKKRSIFLSIVGPDSYKLLRNSVSPEKPGEKTFTELVEIMTKHQSPPQSETVQRCKFNSRFRKSGESIATFVSELKSLSEFCNYGNTLNGMLRDRLVCGINDDRIQRNLLAQPKLTFAKALEIATSQETAARNAQHLKEAFQQPLATPLTQESVMHIPKGHKGQKVTAQSEKYRNRKEWSSKQKCYRCGNNNHEQKDCWFKDKDCHNCGKRGHIAKVCWSKISKVKQVNEDTGQANDKLFDLFNVNDGRAPLAVDIKIDGQSVRMEVDTGASMSIVSEKTFKANWPNKEWHKTDIVLRTYTGATVEILGETEVTVEYQRQKCKLLLIVIRGEGASLLGRDWLQKIRLDWNSFYVNNVTRERLSDLLKAHSELFKEGLGLLKGTTAKIYVDSQVNPKFYKPRSVPYAMRNKVEAELDRLQSEGIITSIVPILKADKSSIRICGDYKVTVNKASKLDQYPIPKIEDLFATLAGGKTFSKLDMSQAYQQLKLDEDSKQSVVINTHKGLFQYNRLPFGISSAPGIFQRAIEGILQGMPNVVVYLDDILITGATEEEHLMILDEVLSHVIDEKGLHPMPEKVKAIKEAPAPRNVTELKSYLGLLTYYGKFLSALSTTLAPLYDLLRKDTQWRWTQTEKSAFENSKDLLMSSQVLCHYDPTKELILSCDASPYGIGAVLAQKWKTAQSNRLGLLRAHCQAQKRIMRKLKKEGLACVLGVQRFHSYLYGRHFTLFTDHKPLLGLFNEGRAMYEYNLKFKPTDAHANADAMSRLPLPETIKSNPVPPEIVLALNILDQCPVTSSQVRKSSRRDPTLSKILGYVKCVWPEQRNEALKPYYQRRNELSVEDGCLLWGNRVIIPPLLRKPILEELYDCHVGGSRMKSFARGFVWWPNLDSEIEKLVKECPVCRESRPNPPKAPLHSWPQPNRPWSRIHIDFAGPFMGHMLLVI